MFPWVFCGLLVTIIIVFTAWMRFHYAYWARRGVKFIKPLPIVGNMLTMLTQSESFTETMQKKYHKLKTYKFGGIFEFLTPTLVITDPDMIKDITVTYFNYFYDRRSVANNKTEPLLYKALISLKGQEWKEMRNLVSPAFTTNKLRAMFPLISKCGEQLARSLLSRSDSKLTPIEFRSTFTRFTTDVIATVAFGVETNAVNNPEDKFHKFGQRIMDFSGLRIIVAVLYATVPKLMEILNIPFISREVTTFFRDLISKVKQFRKENNVTRPDVIQLLIDAQRDSCSTQEQETTLNTHDSKSKHLSNKISISKALTDDDIAAQAFTIFMGSFDTVTTVLSFMSHEIAIHPEIQQSLQEEIDSAILRNDGELTYDVVQSLKYLDMVISETLRKYPPAGFTDRKCTRDFKIPETNVLIEKDTLVMIPIYALQNDAEYFPNPNQFDPERFSDENKINIRPYTYLPFGAGHHNCIGIRLGLLQVKICAVYLLATYKLQVCSETQIPLQLSKTTFQMTTDAGFWLLCVPRDDPSIKILL